MAGSNTDRGDTIRMLRDQASRVYLQTIAANEREDRILHKKLDALDLEHRAQFLKMKKWIQDAHSHRKKRLKALKSNASYRGEMPPLDITKQKNDRAKVTHAERTAAFQKEDSAVKMPNKVERKEICILDKNKQLEVYKSRRRSSSMLRDRVKYTESEVAHLKASFAGQKTPPHLRRRTFLPHLHSNNAAPISGTDKRKNRSLRKRANEKQTEKVMETMISDLTIEEEEKDYRLPNISITKSRTPVIS